MKAQWFPLRTPITVSQLRQTGLYPDIEPPTFSQRGGFVPNDFQVLLNNDGGDIYYTTDDSDPRLVGGTVNPDATRLSGSEMMTTVIEAGATWKYNDTGTDLGTAWREPGFDDAAWPEGAAPIGYGLINNTEIATTANTDRHLTMYARKNITR